MSRKLTFRDILARVAEKNALALDQKAHTASSLAVVYSESESAFRRIESAAIEQMVRILVYVPWNSETWPARESLADQAELAVARLAAA